MLERTVGSPRLWIVLQPTTQNPIVTNRYCVHKGVSPLSTTHHCLALIISMYFSGDPGGLFRDTIELITGRYGGYRSRSLANDAGTRPTQQQHNGRSRIVGRAIHSDSLNPSVIPSCAQNIAVHLYGPFHLATRSASALAK